MKKYSSFPRSHIIDNVFYKAGFVETWGRALDNLLIETVLSVLYPHLQLVEIPADMRKCLSLAAERKNRNFAYWTFKGSSK